MISKSLNEIAAEVVFWPARVLLLAMLFASPWYYGSVTWQAQTYYLHVTVVILVLSIVGAILRKEAIANPLIWSLAGLLSLALLQTVQLPEWLWQSVSTSAAFERSTAKAEGEFLHSTPAESAPSSDQITIANTPRTLSIHWVQTRASIAMFAVAIACLISAGILFRSSVWEVALLTVLALSGLSIAMLGILQSVAWNKWTLLPMPTTACFATYVSRNSAPQFLAIGLGSVIGLLAWWSGRKTDEADKRYYVRYPAINAVARFRRRLEELVNELDMVSLICIFSATLIFVAVLAAGSRGGILSCLAAGVLTLCISLGTKGSYARIVGLVTAMGCGAVLLLTTLELDSAIWQRMDSVNEEVYKLNNGRILVWQMVLSQPSCWLPGCGLGNFHFAILPAYRGEPTAWFYHAENIYIELLAEFGIAGFAIGMAGLTWLVLRIRWCVISGRRAAPTFVATTLAVSAIALQSLVDFSLIIPSICLPLAVLVGCFLARSHCPDFGRKSSRENRKNAQRKTTRSIEGRSASDSHWFNTTSSVALLSLVIFSIWVSAKPLSGFAFAEQLNRQTTELDKTGPTKTGKQIGDLIEAIDISQAEQFADHPEVNLQIGRLLQIFAGEMFREQLPWPADTTAESKVALSEPASIAASFRAKSDSRMVTLRELAKKLPQQVEALKRSASRMAAASSVCSLDWRSELGVVRSDLNWFTSESRARNYARLLHVTGHSYTIPAGVGIAANAAGESQVGYRFLNDYLTRVPKQASAVAESVVQQMPADVAPDFAVQELLKILPESPLLRVEVAESLSTKKALVSKELASSIDLKDLFSQVKQQQQDQRVARPWQLVGWLAEERKDTKTKLEALANAVSADPMNHAMHFELAQQFLANGQRSEAFQHAERAYRLSPENVVYRAFREETRSQP